MLIFDGWYTLIAAERNGKCIAPEQYGWYYVRYFASPPLCFAPFIALDVVPIWNVGDDIGGAQKDIVCAR